MNDSKAYWRKCSICKKEISYGATYQVCSVSSCRKSVYCSVTCWDVHVPIMNHKSAWAEERTAPLCEENEKSATGGRRILVTSQEKKVSTSVSLDILIVASKLKKYVKDRHDMNSSGNVMDRLSDMVRRLCDQAVENARMDGRKTLMDRDFM